MKFGRHTLKSAAVLAIAGLAAATAPAKAGPLIGEVRAFGENFCPRGWARADGQLLAISSNTALFSIIGTMYGGDGRTTMGLPNLIGRVPQSQGTGPGLAHVSMGQQGGAPTRTLSVAQMPAHNHIVNATNAQGNKLGPGGDLLADPNTNDPNTEVHIYKDGSATPNQVMDPGMIGSTGGSQPIAVQSPYLVLNWCIATTGTFPSRN
ncbi:tail fiber protein [Alisedimentitalea sp. MJ-SS2]|uniref:phage tail protein n=1 Tax=Aliisedimentitalea sp. MJ-SS2 TaxID=3049795 RepID=UPI0029132F90|nr:tail fiber protein [Alisedimentitalea sp. MJ-SS2]MDU8930045.1 tail fiber protein [Alisedimentitalea sp. MJ-SS2]